MAYSELDKRLLKRAVQVEARRVLVKRAAGELLGLYSPGMTNQDVGRSLATHLQALAAYQPGTADFNRYVQENNLDPNAANYLHGIGKQVIQLARDPSTHHITGGNFGAEGINKLLASPEGQGLYKHIEAGFDTGVMGIGKGLEMATNTPLYQQQLKQDETAGGFYSYIPESVRGAMNVYSNEDAYRQQAKGQIMEGFGQGLNTNSPLVRQAIAQGATGYLENKINQWAPRDSAFGRGANSLGKFLLGLFSMMPGYESIVNWLANRDFMFGKELRALPGQVQAQGARMLSGGTAPQQTVQPQQVAATPQQPTQPPAAPRQVAAPAPAPASTAAPSLDPMEQQINREIARQDAADASVALAGRGNQGPQNTRGGAVVDASGRAVVSGQQGQVDNANNARSTLGMSTGVNTTATRPNTNISATPSTRRGVPSGSSGGSLVPGTF